MAELPDGVNVKIDAKINVLVRPISMARIQTVDWDELRELADIADSHVGTASGHGYAAGVRDALRWMADGVPSAALLEVLGEG